MESTETLTREPGQDADPSLLDTVETTAHSRLPSDYRYTKSAKLDDEILAAEELYTAWDIANGSDKLENLLNCRHFAWFVRHNESGMVKVVANACHLRWCPICAQTRRMIIKKAVAKWLKEIKRPKFMTFTIKHSTEPLVDQIRRLYNAYRLFRQHKFLRKKQRGGVWFFQLKRSKKTGEWHPHLHVVVDMDYVNKVEIQDDWFLTTGDSFIVDIRAVKNPKKVSDYVARYCACPCNLSDYSTDDKLTIANTLNGKRLCGRFGTGASCKFKPERPIDFAKWERVVNWSDCILNRIVDNRLASVLKAWSNGTPLDSQSASEISDTYAPTKLLTLHPAPKTEEKQYYFEEFKT